MLDQRRTHDAAVPPADMLTELEPALQRGLDRHLAQATEWFPHEYVPYEVGRNYIEEPWEPTDSHLSEISRLSLEVNLLTEDNLPYYHLALVGDVRPRRDLGRVGPSVDRRGGPARDRPPRLPDRDAGARPRRARARTHEDGSGRLLPGRQRRILRRSLEGWCTPRCRSSRPGSRSATPGSTRTIR